MFKLRFNVKYLIKMFEEKISLKHYQLVNIFGTGLLLVF